MTRVAKFLDGVDPFLRDRLDVLDGTVDQEECAIRFEDACGFAHERGWIAKVMGGHAGRYQIEFVLGVWKGFGGVLPCFDMETAFARGGGGPFQHRGGNIGKGDLPAGTCQAKPRMPRAGGDIEGSSRLQPYQPPQRILDVGYVR